MDARSGMPVGVELRTSDAAIGRSFYGPLLGWDSERGDGDAPIGCRLDGDQVATVRVDGAEPGAWRLVLARGSVPGLDERVDRAGGTTIRVVPHLVDVADPLGATCTVDERADRGALKHGWARASWFEIMTTDAEVTDRFYRSVFDYRANAPTGAAEDGPFVVLEVGGQPVAGRLALPQQLAGLLGDRWMTYFAVRDVDRGADQAAQLGAAVLAPPRDAPTGRVCALRDPCGAVFTLLTPVAFG